MRISILIFAYLLVSCNSHKGKASNTVKSTDSSTTKGINPKPKPVEETDDPIWIETNKKSEVLSSETKGPEKVEVTIPERQLKITIIKSYLNSYVQKKYSETTYKYRDVQMSLTIKQNSQILLDTIFRKEDFAKYLGKEYIEGSIFEKYIFLYRGLEQNKVEILGKIDPKRNPEKVLFSHYFDLADKTLKFVVHTGEDQNLIQ